MRVWLLGLGMLVPSIVMASSCALGDFAKVEGPDAGIPDAEGGEGGCGHETVPLPPTLITDAGIDVDVDAPPPVDETFIVALHAIRLVKNTDGSDLGIDLDRFCSCQGETPSCVPPKDQDPSLACDRAAGRDNQMPLLFNALKTAFQLPDLSELYSQFAHLGGWSILMRVSGYNGQPNDAKVRVDWYTSGGDPNNVATPLWNGDDLWAVTSDSVINKNIDDPVHFDPDGYVTDNKLVFTLPSGTIKIAGGDSRFSFNLTTGTILADLQKDASGKYILRDGLITGRIALPDLFRMISDYRTDEGKPICTDESLYPLAMVAFCSGLDIQVGAAQPAKPCDAVSMAIGFDSDPAKLGVAIDPKPDPLGCPPATDPFVNFEDAGCPLAP